MKLKFYLKYFLYFVQISMFWKFDFYLLFYIDIFLEREDVILKELMDEEDVLQECKVQNRKFIEFLLKVECFEDLVSFVIEESF